MTSIFLILLIVGLFCFAVWGGWWVITKFALGRAAQVIFGVIVLVIIVFALIYLVQNHTGVTDVSFPSERVLR